MILKKYALRPKRTSVCVWEREHQGRLPGGGCHWHKKRDTIA